MREIFFDEKLGETGRDSEKLRGMGAARARMGAVEGMGAVGWEW